MTTIPLDNDLEWSNVDDVFAALTDIKLELRCTDGTGDTGAGPTALEFFCLGFAYFQSGCTMANAPLFLNSFYEERRDNPKVFAELLRDIETIQGGYGRKD